MRQKHKQNPITCEMYIITFPRVTSVRMCNMFGKPLAHKNALQWHLMDYGLAMKSTGML